MLAIPVISRLWRWRIAILGGALIGAGAAQKRDPPAIGAPGRRASAIRQAGQLARLAAAEIDRVDLRGIAGAIRAEGQPPAIEAPARMSAPPRTTTSLGLSRPMIGIASMPTRGANTPSSSASTRAC